MVTEGRTMREAINAGNTYQLCGPNGFNYWPVAATDPWEVINWALKRWVLKPGAYQMERVTGGVIGCLFVDRVGDPLIYDGEKFDRRVI